MEFQDAYKVIDSTDVSNPMHEGRFDQLVKDFRDSYLRAVNYEGQVELHRNPMEVDEELRDDLGKRLQSLYNRPEMRDDDPEKHIGSCVSTRVKETWTRDKRLNSQYEAIERYCQVRSKNLNMIAVHMAECLALDQLFSDVTKWKSEKVGNGNTLANLTPLTTPGKTVHPLNFNSLSGQQFEWLVFAWLRQFKTWDDLQWLGLPGSDGGRDIWGVAKGKTYCCQCTNTRRLSSTKAKADIDKLARGQHIPDCYFVVCGGTVSANLRAMLKAYANAAGIREIRIWHSGELEEEIRAGSGSLLQRFFGGEAFPAASPIYMPIS
jgi:hypothetical protein